MVVVESFVSDQMDRTSLQLVPTHLLRWTPPYACIYFHAAITISIFIQKIKIIRPEVFFVIWKGEVGWTLDGVWKLKTGLARLCVSPTTRGHASLDPHPHLHSSTDSAPPFSPDNFYLVLLKNIVRFCCHVLVNLKLMLSTLHIQSEDLELFRKQHWCTRMYEGFIS